MISYVTRSILPRARGALSRSTTFFRATVHTRSNDSFRRNHAKAESLETDMLKDIDLMVCDMAGTTVEEGGTVYATLQKVMNNADLGNGRALSVSDHQMHPWHGAKKEAVLEHFLRTQCTDMSEEEIQTQVYKLGETFVEEVSKAYFGEGSKLTVISPDLFEFFQKARKEHGMKIGLDTGYPPEIQKSLIDALGMETEVDDYISSYQVKEGRPFPYMIHQLMERQGISDTRRVCKVGDSARDMQMGRNAGCGLVVGVLSGADDAESLYNAGADIVIDNVTQLPLPTRI